MANATEDINDSFIEENHENTDTEVLVPQENQTKWYQNLIQKLPCQPTNDSEVENPDGLLDTFVGVIVPVCLSMFRYLK